MASESVGALLLKNTSLTENQLIEVMALQNQNGERLSDFLARENLATLEDVLRALCSQTQGKGR